MRRGRSSRPCLRLKVELTIRSNAKELYQVLSPDDVPVEGLDYKSELRDDELIYTFESSSILKLRNAVDDVLEKISLAEAVKREVVKAGQGNEFVGAQEEGRSKG